MVSGEVKALREERFEAGWMSLLGALWLGLFPLWQDGSYTRITHAKWVGMLALTALTAAGTLALLTALARRRELGRVRLHPAQALALAYLGWMGLSAAFGAMADSVNELGKRTVWMGAARYEGLLTQGCYIGVFLMLSLYPVRPRAVMNAAAAGLLLYAGVVALQYMWCNPFGLFPRGMSVWTNVDFQGTIGNVDMVSGYLCLLTPMLLFAYALGKLGKLGLAAGWTGLLMTLIFRVQSGLIAQAGLLALLILMLLRRPEARARGLVVLAGVLATVSARGLLGLPWVDGTDTWNVVFPYEISARKLAPLAAALLLALLARGFHKRPGRALSRRAVALLAALAVAAALAALLLVPAPEGGGLWELQESLRGRPQDAFGSERVGVWRLTLQMSREHPVFGTGPDTFLYAMADYLTRTGQTLRQRFDNPHNMLLAALANSGVPAAALWAALMICLLVSCLRRGREDGWPLAFAAGLTGYLAQGMFTFSLCVVTPMFWAAAGMTAALTARERKKTP